MAFRFQRQLGPFLAQVAQFKVALRRCRMEHPASAYGCKHLSRSSSDEQWRARIARNLQGPTSQLPIDVVEHRTRSGDGSGRWGLLFLCHNVGPIRVVSLFAALPLALFEYPN
jgi:hypothetical protein